VEPNADDTKAEADLELATLGSKSIKSIDELEAGTIRVGAPAPGLADASAVALEGKGDLATVSEAGTPSVDPVPRC
jgi:hypothetical protein